MSVAPPPDIRRAMSERDVIALPADGGRRYEMGQLAAVFKADEAETGSRYSVPEWILKPGQDGVGAHSHDANEEIFYVLGGHARDSPRRNVEDFRSGHLRSHPGNGGA